MSAEDLVADWAAESVVVTGIGTDLVSVNEALANFGRWLAIAGREGELTSTARVRTAIEMQLLTAGAVWDPAWRAMSEVRLT